LYTESQIKHSRLGTSLAVRWAAFIREDNCFMKKRSNNPADQAAKHLANLLATSVAGITPDSINGARIYDIDGELFKGNNVAIAPLVVLSGLINGSNEQRKTILEKIVLPFYHQNSFENQLFDFISK
jgi:hypothetical protein